MHELYVRYEKQLQRWKDYRNLFVFLGFVTLFLAVLYLQRSADVAYKVHSTVESVVLPSDSVMQNTDEVYSWLNNLLTVRGARGPHDSPPTPKGNQLAAGLPAVSFKRSNTQGVWKPLVLAWVRSL